MCLSKVYLSDNGENQLIMGEVAAVEIKDDKLILKSLFGEEKEIAADIKEVDFLKNSVIIGSPKK